MKFMKAFQISKYGKRGTICLAEVPVPTVADNEVLVEIHAAALNPLDSKIKNGDFKLILPYKLPLILGHDMAGVVKEVGRNVSAFKVGDEVYARVPDFHIGTLAQFISVNEGCLALKPSNLTFEEAASLPLVALTAWQALAGHVKEGQHVFIQAGSGGVGTIAIQLAKYLKAFVATTASNRSFDKLKKLGADVLIDYRTQDFQDVLSDYDFVLNSQNTDVLKKSISITRPGGTVVSLSGPPTSEFASRIGSPWILKCLMQLMSFGIRRQAKGKGVHYHFLFMQPDGGQLSRITRLVEAGIITPVVDKIFNFDRTPAAMAYLESGHAKGKVVVRVR